MKQRLFPVAAPSHRIQIIQTHQLALLQIVEQRRAVLDHLSQRQVYRRLATLLKAQTGCMQQVTSPYALTAPQIDQAFRPAGIGPAPTLDIERKSVVWGER